MKKILLTTIAVTFGALFSHAQGLVNLSVATSSYFATTNNGVASGALYGNYYFEVLDSTATGANQLSNTNLSSLAQLTSWTDSGVSGTSYTTSLNKGKINASASSPAANWAAPTAGTYSSATPDSYIVVGWDSTEGTSWLTVSNELATGTLVSGGWFGVTVAGINVTGGGPNSLGAVTIFGNTSGISGYGLSSGIVLTPVATPEPSTMALAGLGGLSMLLFRRKN